MKYLIILLIGIIFWTCSNQENKSDKQNEPDEIPDGGPCSYRYDSIPAIILEISPQSDSQSDLTIQRCFSSDDSLSCDTIFYSQVMNRKIENTELEKLQFKIGDTLLMRVGTIIEGHCNPENDYIDLIRFKN